MGMFMAIELRFWIQQQYDTNVRGMKLAARPKNEINNVENKTTNSKSNRK